MEYFDKTAAFWGYGWIWEIPLGQLWTDLDLKGYDMKE